MAPAQHSNFSASASARLLACPGSYALALAVDDGTRTSSTFAAEGTLAHAIAEASLHTSREPADFIGQSRTTDGYTFTVDQDFADFTSDYVDHVRGLRAMGYLVALEARVNPKNRWHGLVDLDVDLFGTSDVVAYHPGTKTLAIVDLKFGRGIAVEAKDNTQLLYYAAGSMDPDLLRALCNANGKRYLGVDHVTTTIVQPRAFHPDGPIRRAGYPADYVTEWARTTLYVGVRTALEDDGKTVAAGKHCRFCPVAAVCEAPRAASLAASVQAFAAAPPTNTPATGKAAKPKPNTNLTDDELGEIMGKLEIIAPWIDAVKALALKRLEAGAKIPGQKLVSKRATRAWATSDAAELRDAITLEGLDPADVDKLFASAALTPAQAEKKIGKAAYDKFVAPHVSKTSSGPTVAPDADPRKAIARTTAEEAFNNPHTGA